MTLLASSLSRDSGWATIYDINFSQGFNITANTDGVYNLNGVNWYKSGSANQNGNVTINSNSLLIGAKSTVPNILPPLTTLLSAPSFYMFPSDVCPAIKGVNSYFNIGIRLWAYVYEPSSNQCANFFISDATNTSSGYSNIWTLRRTDNGSARAMTANSFTISASGNGYHGTTAISALDLTNNVICMEVSNLYIPYAKCYYGAMNDPLWPKFSNLSTFTQLADSNTVGFVNASTENLIIGVSTSGIASTTTLTMFKRIKIEIHL